MSESNIKWVRLNFCDPFGLLQQISTSKEITEEAFKKGLPRLDSSSIKGFKEIYESDMVLKPDPSTFNILPNYIDKDHHNKINNYESKAARLIVVYMKVSMADVTCETLVILHKWLGSLQRKEVLNKVIGVQN